MDIEGAIQKIVTVFLSSSKGKGDLNSKTFRKFVNSNLGNVMEDADNACAIKEMQQGLDADGDGKVGFREYLTLIGYVATSLSERNCSKSNGANASAS